MKLMGCSRRTVQRALDTLCEDRWVKCGRSEKTAVNAYIINDRVAWSGKRDGIRYSLFSAAIILSSDEQPDQALLDELEPLRRVPSCSKANGNYPREQVSPISQPFFDGMEPDLPRRKKANEAVPRSARNG